VLDQVLLEKEEFQEEQGNMEANRKRKMKKEER
jgi:hypothetical protein